MPKFIVEREIPGNGRRVIPGVPDSGDLKQENGSMKRKPYATMSAAFALLVGVLPARGAAQGTESAATLVDAVRRATKAFQDAAAATAAGYAPAFGCVSGPLGGAVGLHFVNGDLVGDGELDAERPEALHTADAPLVSGQR